MPFRLLPHKSAGRWLGSETQLELEKHFTIQRKLGKGSYAVVYQVRRHEDGQLYALKVCDVKSLGREEQKDVVNEVRLLASLQHPNLVRFFEAFFDQGKLCIVQELVGGGDISTIIKKRAGNGQHFSEDQVWATFLQMALGLQYLHKTHVLHRDIKPQNILLTHEGLVKLADLGISQTLDRVFARALIGTPHYMAPEMWRRQPYSYSADIWALGCILHELCTLKPLFISATDEETRVKVLSGQVPPIPARYSPELRALVGQMLQQSPMARPTIDDVLLSAPAQRHLALLPPELRQRCISPALSGEHSLARLIQPIKVPSGPDEWEQINDWMPAPRYTSGSGVFKQKQKSWSTGDLTALAAEAAAEDGGAFGSPTASGGGALAAPPPPPAAEAAAAMRKVVSYGSLAAAVEAELERSSSSLTRRKSLSVGELLQAAGSGPGSGGGPGVQRHRRRPSFSPLDAVSEEAASVGPAGNSSGGGAAPATVASDRAVPAEAGASPGSQAPALWSREARNMRSKSLSVEDAIDTLASGQPLFPAPPRPAAAAGAAPAAARPPPEAGGALPAGAAAGLPPLAAAPAAAGPQPGKALAAPTVTAQVQVQQPGAIPATHGGAKPQPPQPPPPPQQQQQQAPAGGKEEGREKKKGGGFLRKLRGLKH